MFVVFPLVNSGISFSGKMPSLLQIKYNGSETQKCLVRSYHYALLCYDSCSISKVTITRFSRPTWSHKKAPRKVYLKYPPQDPPSYWHTIEANLNMQAWRERILDVSRKQCQPSWYATASHFLPGGYLTRETTNWSFFFGYTNPHIPVATYVILVHVWY